jgi:tetrahydromethanopterin S-methyltransferase subunit B
MQINVDDKEIYDRIIRMDEGIKDIQSDMKEIKTCMDGHGKRIGKLERGGKLQNSGIGATAGAGATGLIALLYLLLQKLGLGG